MTLKDFMRFRPSTIPAWAIVAVCILSIVSTSTLMLGCTTNQAMVATKVSKSNYIIYTGVQKMAASARLNYEDAVATGVEPIQPYIDDSNWIAYVKADRNIVDAHNAYVETLKLIVVGVNDERALKDLLILLATQESYLDRMAQIGLKILVDNGVISGVVW